MPYNFDWRMSAKLLLLKTKDIVVQSGLFLPQIFSKNFVLLQDWLVEVWTFQKRRCLIFCNQENQGCQAGEIYKLAIPESEYADTTYTEFKNQISNMTDIG